MCTMFTVCIQTFTVKLPHRVGSPGGFLSLLEINSVSERLSWQQHEENVCHVTMVMDSMKPLPC